jgi:hypothetical protein
MTIKIAAPQQGQDPVKGALGTIGEVVGSYFGGPVGGMLGAAAGKVLSGAPVEQVAADAMTDVAKRRMDKQDAPKALEDGLKALETQPYEMQEKYNPIIKAALERSKGMSEKSSSDALARRQQRYMGEAP